MGSKLKWMVAVVPIAVACVFALSACGGGDETSTTSASDTNAASTEADSGGEFVTEPRGGIAGALLPEERELWKYDTATGKFEVVAGDASKPYVADIEKFPPGTKIGYIDPMGSDPFAISIRKGFEKLADEYGFEVIYCDTEYKPEKAVSCAEQVVSQEPDFVHAGNWQAGVATAMMKVLDDARVPANNSDVAHPNGIFVGADNYSAGQVGGKAAGEFAKSEWNCEDVWLLLGEALQEGEAADMRLQGFSDGVQEVCGALPEEQIQRERIDATADQALTATTDWQTAHPQAEHVLSVTLGAGRSIGMAKAFQRSDADAYAVGMTCDEAELEVIKGEPASESRLLGCVAFFPERYGPLYVSTAQDVLEGKPVPNEVHVEHEFLDSENVNQYYP